MTAPAAESFPIGLDFGQMNCAVAYVKPGQGPDIIANADGHRCTSSAIFYDAAAGVIEAGDHAFECIKKAPANSITNAKRALGLSMGEEEDKELIDEDIENDMYSAEVVESKSGGVAFSMDGGKKIVTAEEACSLIVSNMQKTAETFLGSDVKQCVVTVPTWFEDKQKQILKDACAAAGMECLRLVSDPVAACMAYDLDLPEATLKSSKLVCVVNLSGAGLDASLVSITRGVCSLSAKMGDRNLGGIKLAKTLEDFCIKDFKRKSPVLAKTIKKGGNEKALYRVRKEVEKVKATLSSSDYSSVEVDNLINEHDLSVKVSRQRFEELNQDDFEEFVNVLADLLDGEGVATSEVTDVILMGGSCKIPKVQEVIAEYFLGEDADGDSSMTKFHTGLNPNELGALGAAAQADMLSQNAKTVAYNSANDVALKLKQGGGDVKFEEMYCLPLSVGVEGADGTFVPILRRGTTVPCVMRGTFEKPKGKNGVKLFEGDFYAAGEVKQNRLLAELEIPAECGNEVDVEITVIHAYPGSYYPGATVSFYPAGSDKRAGAPVPLADGKGLSADDVDAMLEKAKDSRVPEEEN